MSHPLDGPRGRVQRAHGQIVNLQGAFQGFFKDNLYEVGIAEYNPKANHYSLRVKGGPQDFPVDWSLLIGEIAHNLRAALDGLVWQLALRTTLTPYDRTAFPIYLRGQPLKRPSKGRSIRAFWEKSKAGKWTEGGRLLQSVPNSLWARIESFQPYKRGNGGRHSPLVLLEELNNTDKHRLVTVLSAFPGSMGYSGLVGGSYFKFGVPLYPNAKVGWVKDIPPNPPGGGGVYAIDPASLATWTPGEKLTLVEPKMHVEMDIGPSVAFGNSCAAVERSPVIPTLQSMADQVSRVIESREFV